jgi:hypothetical protein
MAEAWQRTVVRMSSIIPGNLMGYLICRVNAADGFGATTIAHCIEYDAWGLQRQVFRFPAHVHGHRLEQLDTDKHRRTQIFGCYQ